MNVRETGPVQTKSFVIAAILIGIALVALHAGWNWWKATTTAQWPSVTGRIITARIQPTTRSQPDGPGPRARNQVVETFVPDVRYEYTVDGRNYVGTRYAYGDRSYERYEAAVEALRDLSAGAQVPVYYNPANPSDSVLQPAAR